MLNLFVLCILLSLTCALWFADCVPEIEPLRMLQTQLIQLLFKQDVSLCLVGVEEAEFCGVGVWVAEYFAQELEHGGDSRATLGKHVIYLMSSR